MSTPGKASRPSFLGVVSTLLVLVLGGVSGALLGGLFVRLFVPKTGMGWDQIADALGGLMLGGLLGLVAGGVLVFFLDVRRRFMTTVALLVISTIIIIGLALLHEPAPSAEPVVREKPFAPWFRASIRVGHSERILLGIKPSSEPVPFTEAGVWTAVPELEHTGWGPDLRRCKAEPSRDDLNRLLPLVTAAAKEASAGRCRTPREDDLIVGIAINLDGEKSSASVEGDCLAQRPAMVALTTALDELAARLCPQ